MSENTKIEWCDHTFNPWEGCQKVGPGCDHCYAETRNARFGGGTAINWGPGAPRRRTSVQNWNKPIAWNKNHDAFFSEHGRRQRVFCASLADVFDNAVDPQWRDDLFALILSTPNLDWLLLTKRIGNVGNMLPVPFDFDKHYPNVWIGATIVNQEEADRDIPKLLAVPAAKRFLSMEPLLGLVNLRHLNEERETNEVDCLKPFTWDQEVEQWRGTEDGWEESFEDHYGQHPTGLTGPMHAGIDWVIVGGESGPNARPMHPDWARSLRDQCQAAGVPFLFKQFGEWGPTWFEAHNYLGPLAPLDPSGVSAIAGTRLIVGRYEDGRAYEDIWPVIKAGKKAAGRLLDGITHDGVPT